MNSDLAEAINFEHQPVMLSEILEVFSSVPDGYLLDATLGGAGHASALLDLLPHCRLIALDRDLKAIETSRERLARFGDRVVIVQSAFRELESVIERLLGGIRIVGFLFDLGFSSAQIDEAGRGFSYRQSGPLDMRMDRGQEFTASDIVNGYTKSDLTGLIRSYGDERFAHRIAETIVAGRPIQNTLELADLIREAIPAATRRRGGHPAKRTFQALRIEVNDELRQLPLALDHAMERLVPGGRGVVLSYHSGEDRIVKQRIKLAATGGCLCPPQLPCACGAMRIVRVPHRKLLRPSGSERVANPRSKSARLRFVERIEGRIRA